MAKGKNVDADDGSQKALIASIISFFFPGLGLLLSRENKMLGVIVFAVAITADVVIFVVGTIGLLCFIGALLYPATLIVHLLAAVHTYDKMTKEGGGKPIMFG